MANFTKQAIKASFMKLLNQKPLSKISVRDIVEDCGINRNSFYYHFQDIMEVVEWYQDQALRQSIEKSLAAPSYKEAIRGVVYETFQHRQLILQLMASQRRKEMELLFSRAVRTYLQELLRGKGSGVYGSSEDIETVISFCSFGLVGMMLSALNQKNPDVDALANQLCRLLTGEITFHFADRT